MSNVLLWLLFLPLATAVVVALLGKRADAVRWLSLAATVVCLALAVAVAIDFANTPRIQRDDTTFQPRLETRWELLRLQGVAETTGTTLSDRGTIQFYIGIDGLNIWLVVLTALLMVSCVLVSWTAITDRANEFYAWLLALETAMVGVFLSFDIILFYVFFELTLVPLFFLIGIWGGPQRQYAARKFFIYTLTGSLITLLGVLGIVLALYQQKPARGVTFSIPRLVWLVGEHNQSLTQKIEQANEELKTARADKQPAPDGEPSRVQQ